MGKHSAVERDVERIQGLWDVRFLDYSSTRRRLGGVVVGLRRLLQTALFPLLAHLSEFHAAIARRLTALVDFEAETAATLAQLACRVADIEARIGLAEPTSANGRRRDLEVLLTEALPGARVAVVDPADRDLAAELVRSGFDAPPPSDEPVETIALLPAEFADVILLGRVLERSLPREVRTTLRAAKTKLAPQGLLVIRGTDPRTVSGLLEFWSDPERLRPYNAGAVGQMLSDTGFVSVEVLPGNGVADGAARDEYVVVAYNHPRSP